MKKIILILFILFNLNLSFASAHELIPKQVQVYLEQNPNASIEEVRAFIDSQGQELKDQFRNREDIERILDRKTSFLDNMKDFMIVGVKHILSGPDHILFVISLLLIFVSWRDILRLTGVFTLAHSITLVLAGTGILVLSSRIVEPLIALSISYVAITSVFFKDRAIFASARNKMATVFFFGLFHGLGFAGLLEEIHIPKERFVSSLFSFNVGIEIGQIVVVLFALPLILSINKMASRNLIIKIIACSIGLLGILWAVQRIAF